MSESTQQAVDEVRRHLREIEIQLADPQVLSDPVAMGRLGKRHSRLRHVVSVADRVDHLAADIQAAEDLADEDPAFAQEADALRNQLKTVNGELTELLAPSDGRDPFRRGWRGVRPVRRRPATDVHPLCREGWLVDS